jgi:hypothetical protein
MKTDEKSPNSIKPAKSLTPLLFGSFLAIIVGLAIAFFGGEDNLLGENLVDITPFEKLNDLEQKRWGDAPFSFPNTVAVPIVKYDPMDSDFTDKLMTNAPTPILIKDMPVSLHFSSYLTD